MLVYQRVGCIGEYTRPWMVWERNCTHLKLWGSRFNGSLGAMSATKMFMEEDDDDPNMEMEEEYDPAMDMDEYDPDQVLNAAAICPLVQLPAEICKGLSQNILLRNANSSFRRCCSMTKELCLTTKVNCCILSVNISPNHSC